MRDGGPNFSPTFTDDDQMLGPGGSSSNSAPQFYSILCKNTEAASLTQALEISFGSSLTNDDAWWISLHNLVTWDLGSGITKAALVYTGRSTEEG